MNYTLHLPENYVKPPLPGRDEWIAALRGGEYQQCQEMLCDGKGYCCLGVLSKMQGRLKKEILQWVDGDCSGALDDDNPLHSYLQDFVGSGNGSFPKGVTIADEDNNSAECLSEANDAGLTFIQIADIIEQVWEHTPKNW